MKPRTSRPSRSDAVRQYRALMDHCDTCHACKTDTTKACPEADRLRHEWSLARRGVST